MMHYLLQKYGNDDFPKDTDILLSYLREKGLDNITREEVIILYKLYCEECWCAGWLIIDDYIPEDFRQWILDKNV